MPAQIITSDDLKAFRVELLSDIKKLLSEKSQPAKKWLKSPDVRRMLNISHGTLQTLRINGTIPYSKVGGSYYYDPNEIQKVFEKQKHKLFIASLDK